MTTETSSGPVPNRHDGERDPFGQLMTYACAAHVLRAAMQLGLPDAVGDDSVSVQELARRTDSHPAILQRLLRALSAIGVFRPVGENEYEQNAASDLLRSGRVGQLIVQALTEESFWQAWNRLADGVRNGDCPFVTLHELDFYGFLSRHEDKREAFHAAMNDPNEPARNDELINALDLTGVKRVVDVGGSEGSLLRDLLRSHPHIGGVLFDTEEVVAHALADLRCGELADRCEIVSGDARESVPPAGDLYLLRGVLHNWDDETCVRILSRCAEAAGPGARVVVLELLLDDTGRLSAAEAMIDLHMFVLLGARERAEDDFAKLFERAGLTYTGATPTSYLHLIEARNPGH
ncbi:methyltransferase [Saccharopolyspora phatthalungensis]|uniref:Precorrin-6B methylase 2 n=1 Tax=Saccharopolyspora phatthalungensis TaxID=664693 RepID=A0A840QFA4_9PSEU|nr:methyltransferase [Saccharopolyspora phatthalungensis]MBB5159514.1 precorrin-6B methylase 2 [Saccharopolyspora phatthalungensis]